MPDIILDRDGVINFDSDEYIKSPEEWQPLPGSLEAISILTQHSYRIFVASNQSGISRGYFSNETLFAMHNKLRALVENAGGEIHGIFYCPHGPEDSCNCRKPMTGLFTRIEQFYHCDFSLTYAIGDSFRDLQAAISMNARPVLVKSGKGEATFRNHKQEINTHKIPVFENLLVAVNHITTQN